jgi:hypothetical protein
MVTPGASSCGFAARSLTTSPRSGAMAYLREHRLVLGVVHHEVVFGLVFLAGIALGTRTKHPLAVAGIVAGAFCALLVIQANAPFVAFASFALIALVGLVVDSVRETVGLLLGR